MLWASASAIDWMSFSAYLVGVAGIIILGYHFEWFGILVAATAVATGVSVGLAVFSPFWTELPVSDGVTPWSAEWLWYHAPVFLPVAWAAIALLLLGCVLATRAISQRRRARIAG